MATRNRFQSADMVFQWRAVPKTAERVKHLGDSMVYIQCSAWKAIVWVIQGSPANTVILSMSENLP